MDTAEILVVVFIVILVPALFLFTRGMDASEVTVTDTFSDFNIKKSMMYEVLSAPCLNDVVIARAELKKFIFDRSRLDKEMKNGPEISCLNLGNTKYRIYVKDYSPDNRMWIFSNYQPADEITPEKPDIEQVIQINDYTAEPPSEDALIDFDKYKKGLLSASFILGTGSGNFSDTMFCEGKPADKVAIIPENVYDNFGLIKSSYYYTNNNCDSGNCIKGPGQAYATCQPKENKYDKLSGACTYHYECKSAKCVSYACTDAGTDARSKLMTGQPCMSNDHLTFNESCETGYCKYNIFCARCKSNADCTAPKTCNSEGICV